MSTWIEFSVTNTNLFRIADPETLENQLHITLVYLEKEPDNDSELALRQLLSGISFGMQPFYVELIRLDKWHDKYIVALAKLPHDVVDMRYKLFTLLKGERFQASTKYDFKPHITLRTDGMYPPIVDLPILKIMGITLCTKGTRHTWSF